MKFFRYLLAIVIITCIFCEVASRFLFPKENVSHFKNHITQLQKLPTADSHTPFWMLNVFWGFNHSLGLSALEFMDRAGGEYQYPLKRVDFEHLLSGIKANNYGFLSKTDYPYTPEANEYVIGLFGGSVATFWWSMQHEEAEKRLELIIGQKVKILDFAIGAAKQPQQVNILSYFAAIGQHLDMIINIDGYNEVANTLRNFDTSIPYSYPFAPILSGYVNNVNFSEVRAEVILAKRDLNDISSRINSIMKFNQFFHSRFVAYICSKILELRENKYTRLLEATSNLDAASSETFLLPKSCEQNETTRNEKVKNLWVMSSLMMQKMSDLLGVQYIEFIQPSQYHCVKRFSLYEKENAIDDAHRKLISDYPTIKKEVIAATMSQGIYLEDLKDIFDDETDTIYVDRCCHINFKGNRIITDTILNKISTLLHRN